MENTTNYKKTVAGSIGAGLGSVFNASGRKYYILEHKTESQYHHSGESQKIIVDQIELGRDSSCQVRFDESFETVSRRHAAIVKEGDGWKLIPLSQTNGTYVNGQPVQGEWHLTSGDEIRLSSRGPVMGFIVPQGKQSVVSSIGLTERMSLFRQQALRPYKRALIIMGIVLVLAVAGLIIWNVMQSKKYEEQSREYRQQIEQVNDDILKKDREIDALNENLKNIQDESSAEYSKMLEQAKQAREERKTLEMQSKKLQEELNNIKTRERVKEQEQAEMKRKAEEEAARKIKEAEEAAAKKAAEEAEKHKNNPDEDAFKKAKEQLKDKKTIFDD